MQQPISNFIIPEKLKERMKQAVREGKAKNLSELVRKALEHFLEEN
jgi:Arc/MetJ-type ribon-helix-helix transcriptional regulator